MTPGELDDAVQAAAAAALTAFGAGPAGAGGRAGVRRPRHPEQGDYASPVALRLAKETGLPAGELARAIAIGLGRHPGVRRAEAAGPGFVSIWLTARASGDLAGLIVADGQAYGRSDRLAGRFGEQRLAEHRELLARLLYELGGTAAVQRRAVRPPR